MTSAHYAIICVSIIVPVIAQFEGDRCKTVVAKEIGKCIPLDNCDHAKNVLKLGQKPQHCGFNGFTPIVCCPLTTKPVPGQKSEQHCSKYHPKPAVPFRNLVFGGKQSLAKEFPHMAILGYGDKSDIRWLCGGSLISEEFVLTAAHCVISIDLGLVQWVRLGDLDINKTTDDAKPQNFAVLDRFIHPQYRSSSHYHDIAVIKVDRVVQLNIYVRPACLYTRKNVTEQLIATGWGKLDFLGESSNHLMKVDLNYVSFEECSANYADVNGRKLQNGIVDDLQICAGGPDGKDTCPGDSGGPLQFKGRYVNPFYYIVGVTSFGKACGSLNSVGVYTRVANYVAWIEDIVWPED